MVAGTVWGRRGQRGEGPLVSEAREEEVGSGRQRLSGCVGACEWERNGPSGLAGPVLLLGWNPGAGLFLILSPFSFSVSIFWIDFQMNSSFI